MPDIDYKFISELEGGQKLNGYVPAAGVSKSGVTIATGFDLGARNESDLTRLGIGGTLLTQLKPYLGKQKNDAVEYLKKHPLTISKSDADKIDKAVKSKDVATIKSNYNAAIGNDKTKFESLFSEAQTVIASVGFQYGPNFKTKAPTFWKHITDQDWDKAISELKQFGDKYPTRRKKEATLLETGWNREKAAEKK
jgi:GH24 family phage-related lysozyme (muramidase)